MRRLWAYITLAFTALVAVGATFVGVLTRTNSNAEYQEGRELTFRIQKDEDKDDAADVSKEGTEAIAQEMVRRLETAKVTRYEVDTVGDDTVKVILSQDSDEDYSYIAQYLSFNGNLALSYGTDYITADEFLTDKDAYLETRNGIPCIILPVDVESPTYVALLEKITTDKSNEETQYAETTSTTGADGESTEEETHYYLYLWYNFVEGKCTHDAAQNSDNDYYSRVLMKFEITGDDETQYYPDGDNNKLYTAINVDTNGDNSYSVAEKETAYKKARYFINLVNAGELDYKVNLMSDEAIQTAPWIEPLVDFSKDNNHLVVAWSNTFAATLCAIVILTFLLVVYYRLSAVSISSLSIISTYIGLLAVLLFKAELNTFGIIGLALVAIASIVSGVIYANKLKEECYRGRSLKKANTEASKKALLPIIDVNVIVVVIGVFCYIFGGAILRNFGVVTVFGGIASLVLNTLGLKGMMWLATNATNLQGKFEAFGVAKENVPNIINEEKQTYFGPYADSDFTKKKKPVGIISIVVLLASAVGLSVFGGLALADKGDTYYSKANELNSVVYFETENESSSLRKDATIEEILSNVLVYEGTEANDSTVKKSLLQTYVTKGESGYAFNKFSRSETIEDETTTYYVCIVEFNAKISNKTQLCYRTGVEGAYTYETTDDNETFESTFNALVNAHITEYDASENAAIIAREQVVYKQQSPKVGPVALGTLIAVAVLAVYFILRYRLSRGLTSLIVGLSVGVITCGFFTLLRFISIPSYIIAALPFVVAFTLMISVILMNREREMVIEDRTKDTSVEHRNEIMVKATSSAFAAILPVTIFALYYGINFFGFGPSSTSWIYIAIILGTLLAALVVTTLYGPIAQLFYKAFQGIKIAKPRVSKKAKTAKVNKSAEPEEAVFIGIND